MKILFVGCVESSYILLSELIKEKKDVVGVITKATSKFNADFVDIGPFCKENNIPFIYVENINDEDSVDFAKKINADICYCFGWSQLLKSQFMGLFKRGVIGYHPAALPNNRGRHPLIWALVLGLNETASTFMEIDLGADTGDIVSQRKISISYEDDARSLYDKVMDEAKLQVIELTNSYENNSVNKIKQDSNCGNSWRKRRKLDGKIDFRMSSNAIYNLVRGLTHPYVGAHFMYNDKDIKVWKVQEIITNEYFNIEPGKVISVNDDGSVDIKTYDNLIRLIEFDEIVLKEGEYL